ncbi:Uncharacterized conserved protein UCP016719 [Pleurostoma richardsiae]|uniref:Uncharacterized conserved protein UCP016719 n=1 Tax=Pleurostoma richardsiae TaxID=41990 RepID=A0AA38VTJ8_9PEZI|nr:Uncharacterized conserved protein UCP016719 [Pleurostoma richardsiae]
MRKSVTFFLGLATAALASNCKGKVKTGLDVLLASDYAAIAGKKVLVLSNPTGVSPELDLGVDLMFESGKVNLVGVMGPEHGFRGTSQAGGGQSTFVDEKTGLTVYDAYNVNTTTLEGYIGDSGADTVLFDIQDIGARFYTYIWAMYDTMVAASVMNVSFVVLDRPNPITGLNAFGPILNESYITSYVGRRAIAQAHGMTAGELAGMFVGEGWISEAANGSSLDLQVIKMEGWKRSMTFAQTGLPWVIPSPNMPTPDTALIYPGACMFEGTSISEGRGTTLPFELLGAPWANESWSLAMRALGIPHTNYRFACFTPTTSKFTSETACGVQNYIQLSNVKDYEEFDPVYVGVGLLWTARHLYTVDNTTGDGITTDAFHWIYGGSSKTVYDIDVLTGSPLIRDGIEKGLHPAEIKEAWLPSLEEFKQKRTKYLLY